ncbi:MAG: cytosine permease [Actinobacteria bacterium]|nr:cytosine permease [Actinomycetota bacterium]
MSSSPERPVTEPIPVAARRLTGVDVGVLWSNMGISLLGIVAGAGLIAYGAGSTRALVATAIGGVIGGLMLAAAGALGASSGQPGMVVLRRALGDRGSYLPTALNILQGFGWGTFELLVIAEAARLIVDVEARWPFAVAAGVIGTALSIIGPENVTRRVLKRFVTPLVAIAIVYLLLRLAIDGTSSELGTAVVGGIGLMAAIDLVVANFASWQPLVPDYTRFAKSIKGAALGVGLGFGIASTLTFAVGILAAVQAGGIDNASAGVAVILAVPLGTLVAAILVVDESEKGFANIYSTAVSVRNFAPRAPQTPIVIAIGVIVTLGAVTISLDRFFDFLYLLGAVFVPLFGAVFADRIRPVAPHATIVAWVAGFLLYEWLSPTRLLGISDHVSPLLDGALGATIPSFMLAAAIRLAWPSRR